MWRYRKHAQAKRLPGPLSPNLVLRYRNRADQSKNPALQLWGFRHSGREHASRPQETGKTFAIQWRRGCCRGPRTKASLKSSSQWPQFRTLSGPSNLATCLPNRSRTASSVAVLTELSTPKKQKNKPETGGTPPPSPAGELGSRCAVSRRSNRPDLEPQRLHHADQC